MDLKIISAGAGSGKTYRLTREMVELLADGRVRASGIIATTFTNKAAAELQERVRVKLLEEGMVQQANDLTNALIGTVHGLGVKLLKRFAFEAGVSPEVDIIAEEDQQLMFNKSLASVLTNERVAEMETLSERLGLKKSTFNLTDWRRVLKDLTEVARANNFSPDVLEKSKTESFQAFSAFLDQPAPLSEQEWNERLRTHLRQAIARLNDNEDNTKKTATAVKQLKELLQELDLRQNLHWHQWVKLSKIQVGAKSRDDIRPLSDFANKHLSNKAFHNDIRSFIFHIFDLAQKAMDEYSRYKKSRGLIDYTDMEVLVNCLLDDPAVVQTLRDEIDLLMVDEFQDTSPLQLEIFLKLSKIARHSVWVGDPKQSIYGFRGAEPALMHAIIARQGGLKKENILPHSWRSREDIVYAVNAIFTKAFKDMPVEQVVLLPRRCKKASGQSVNKTDEPAEMGRALIHWHFVYDGEGRKPGRSWLDHCIAEQVKVLLERAPLVLPKGKKDARPLQPGDIAILCRSNKKCQDVADALHRAGLKAAISRAGLLHTAEAKLILACLKFILNKYDSLSVAEILLLASGLQLGEVVEDRLAWLNGEDAGHRPNAAGWAENDPFIQRLNALRPQVAELSSAEMLALLLEELNLRRIIATWGNTDQRLANVDVLIHWSFQYEEACNRLHTAASPGGFLLWLNELEENEKDMQGAGENPLAVNVLTYHKSKGLEFPLVVCHSLDQDLREDVWGLTIVPGPDGPDLDNLLSNRWLRFWVNPYADQFRNTLLEQRINASPAKAQKRKEALEEEARLLYVGITRARDYLVIPTWHKPAAWLNRVFFHGKSDQALLDPHSDISPLEWQGNCLPFEVEVVHHPADFGQAPVVEPEVFILQAPAPSDGHNHRPYFFDEKNIVARCTLEESLFAPPPQLPNVPDVNIAGQAALTYWLAEKTNLDTSARQTLAIQILQNYEVDDWLPPDTLIPLEERFDNWLKNNFKIKKACRQYPVRVHINGQLLETDIDLLLETETGFQLFLFSPFIGDKKKTLKKAKELSGKLLALKKAIRQIFDNPPTGLFILFPLGAMIVKVRG